MKPKSPSRAPPGLPQDAESIDALYGLEPVFEPAAGSSSGLISFVTVECPYCGESFDTAVDWSAGAFRYIEDCHVCCQPIELAGDVDDAGTPLGVTATRS
jgi:Cysteine-rich CPXCG